LRSASRTCVLLGTSHSKWCTDAEFRGALEERLRNKVDVKIFFLDPGSPAAALRATEEAGRDTLNTIRWSIQFLWTIRTDLPVDLQRRLKLYTYRATPSMGVACMILEPGRYGAKRKGLYETYARNVKSIEEGYSTPITQDNVNDYMP
jgi:hypothetical protein